MRGGKVSTDEKTVAGFLVEEHEFIYKNNYLEIPILISYSPNVFSKISPKVFFGSVASVLLNAKLEMTEYGKSIGEIDIEKQFKSTEIGVIIGIGAEYNLPTSIIVFDIRYQHGLTNKNKFEDGSSIITSKTISFNVGFGLTL